MQVMYIKAIRFEAPLLANNKNVIQKKSDLAQ